VLKKSQINFKKSSPKKKNLQIKKNFVVKFLVMKVIIGDKKNKYKFFKGTIQGKKNKGQKKFCKIKK